MHPPSGGRTSPETQRISITREPGRPGRCSVWRGPGGRSLGTGGFSPGRKAERWPRKGAWSPPGRTGPHAEKHQSVMCRRDLRGRGGRGRAGGSAAGLAGQGGGSWDAGRGGGEAEAVDGESGRVREGLSRQIGAYEVGLRQVEGRSQGRARSRPGSPPHMPGAAWCPHPRTPEATGSQRQRTWPRPPSSPVAGLGSVHANPARLCPGPAPDPRGLPRPPAV